MIVCLCGSTRFKESFEKLSAALALEGHIVLSPRVYSHYDHIKLTPEAEAQLFQNGKDQIALADEIYFITGDNEYIGQSGYKEICYVRKLNKPLIFFPNWKIDKYIQKVINNKIEEAIKEQNGDS